MNKKGDKIISVYWFAILFIVAAGIVYMVVTFYGKPYDVRGIESEILTNNIADCLSQGGYLKENVFDNGNFLLNETNFLEKCHLNFDVEDVYGWEEQEQYYVGINFHEFDQNTPDGFGGKISEIVKGNVNLIPLVEVSKLKGRREVDTVVIHYTAGTSAQGAINAIKEAELSVHYMIKRDGFVIFKDNAGEIISGGEKAFKYENETASHAGCYDTRAESGKGKWRPECSEVSPECIRPAGSLKEECKIYLSDISEEKKCCIRGYNKKSIGIELVNLGDMCEATTGYCNWSGGTCKSICEDEGKGIEINEIVWEEFTEEQINSLVDLVSGIVSRHGIPIDREHIIGHEEITNFKSDPGPAFNWTGFMESLWVEKRLSPYVGRSFYVLNKADDKQYIIKILAVVGKIEKNVL